VIFSLTVEKRIVCFECVVMSVWPRLLPLLMKTYFHWQWSAAFSMYSQIGDVAQWLGRWSLAD